MRSCKLSRTTSGSYLILNNSLMEKKMSLGPEAKLWRDVRKALKNVHAVRIERRYLPGIPDVNCCYKGVEFWLELKVSKGNYIGLSKFQKAFINERSKHGGKVFVLARPLTGSVIKVFDSATLDLEPKSRNPVLEIEAPYDFTSLLELAAGAGSENDGA